MTVMKTNTLSRLCALSAGVLLSSAAAAYELPVVNLGLTSFMDGGLPAGPGWYFQEYYQVYQADDLTDANGDSIGLPKRDLDYQVAVTQLSYLSEKRLGNASLGMNMLLPLVTSMEVDDGLNNAALKAQDGLGDLMIGPFIQFDPVMGEQGPKFVHRVEFQVNIPTGTYDDDTAINPGNNAWSIDPYWAGTLWLKPEWTVSLRAHYLYNFTNDNPNYTYGDAGELQAGQALHANFATSYGVTKALRLGINGYWLKQVTDSKLDGEDLSDSKEKVWGIGPGLMYSFSADNHIFANAYQETGVENRPDGSRWQVRWVHHF